MAATYDMESRPAWPRRAIITAGEPYGNKGLHFGHVGGVFVPADFFARFLRDRLGRENVIFTSGTDCYGSPIMESYRKLRENEGYDKSISEYVESNHSRQAATLNNYGISCDIYGGSGLEPAAPIHEHVTAEIINRLHERGLISKRSTLQFFDTSANTFLNGRQVIGRCPIQGCKSEKAYADECDLGHQFEPEELIAPKSQLTGEVPELRPVDNLYFDLPAYLDFMKDYTAELARDPQVRSVVSKTMEEWLLPAQLYIQNKFLPVTPSAWASAKAKRRRMPPLWVSPPLTPRKFPSRRIRTALSIGTTGGAPMMPPSISSSARTTSTSTASRRPPCGRHSAGTCISRR